MADLFERVTGRGPGEGGANTLTRSDLTTGFPVVGDPDVRHQNTYTTGNALKLGTGDGTSQSFSLTWDGTETHNQAGIAFTTKAPVQSISGTASRAFYVALLTSDGEKIADASSATSGFSMTELGLPPNTEFYLVGTSDDVSDTFDYAASANIGSEPVASIEGVFTDSSEGGWSTYNRWFEFSDLTITEPSGDDTGEAIVSWPNPSVLTEWDLAQYGASTFGGEVTVDVETVAPGVVVDWESGTVPNNVTVVDNVEVQSSTVLSGDYTARLWSPEGSGTGGTVEMPALQYGDETGGLFRLSTGSTSGKYAFKWNVYGDEWAWLTGFYFYPDGRISYYTDAETVSDVEWSQDTDHEWMVDYDFSGTTTFSAYLDGETVFEDVSVSDQTISGIDRVNAQLQGRSSYQSEAFLDDIRAMGWMPAQSGIGDVHDLSMITNPTTRYRVTLERTEDSTAPPQLDYLGHRYNL